MGLLRLSKGKATYFLMTMQVWNSRMRLTACGWIHLTVSGMQVTRTKGSYEIVWAEDGTRDS